jgi:hypothetical protein
MTMGNSNKLINELVIYMRHLCGVYTNVCYTRCSMINFFIGPTGIILIFVKSNKSFE